MTTQNARKLFVNLSVKDLKKSMEFFSKLGFEFNPKFTDDNAACMIVSEHAFFMLLAEPFFKTFTKREICNTATHTEGLYCISAISKQAVDSLVNKALAQGGKPAQEPIDHGFMYGSSFYDLDGHHWEVMWMDPAAAQ